MHVYIYIYICVCVCVCRYVYIYIYICVCVCVCMYVYIYIYICVCVCECVILISQDFQHIAHHIPRFSPVPVAHGGSQALSAGSSGPVHRSGSAAGWARDRSKVCWTSPGVTDEDHGKSWKNSMK